MSKEERLERRHWLLYKDGAGWCCDKCDWIGPTIDDFREAHEQAEESVPF